MNPNWNPKTWINHPDQILARREWQWTLRWLKSLKGGLGLLLLIIFINLVPWVIHIAEFMNKQPDSSMTISIASMLGGLINAVAGILVLIYTIVLFYRRAWKPLRGARARDLAMTPVAPQAIWPAVLIAPVVFAFVAQLIMVPFAFALNMLNLASNPWAFGEGELKLVSILRFFIQSFASLIVAPVSWASILTFTSANSLPKGGWLRMAFHSISAWIIIMGVSAIVGGLMVLAFSAADLPIFGSGFFSLAYIVTSGFLFPLALSLLIFRVSLTKLYKTSWPRFLDYAAEQ